MHVFWLLQIDLVVLISLKCNNRSLIVKCFASKPNQCLLLASSIFSYDKTSQEWFDCRQLIKKGNHCRDDVSQSVMFNHRLIIVVFAKPLCS